MAKGEPLNVVGMLTDTPGVLNMNGIVSLTETATFGVPCLVVIFRNPAPELFWTADGLSTSAPSSGR